MRAVDRFIQLCRERDIHVSYVQITKGGHLLEEYAHPAKKTRLNTYSVSKSVTSVAAGICIGEGLFSLDDPLAGFFPGIPADADPALEKITVRHLLTMTSGLDQGLFFMDDPERLTTEDWAAYFFRQSFPHEPGSHFQYSNFCTYMIGRIIEQVTGRTLGDFCRDRVFAPMGIHSPDWLSCPQGHTAAANSFFLTIDEMTKFGLLFLGKGSFEGTRIVSERYLSEACSTQVDLGEGRGYGYFFWTFDRLGAYAALGNYGQFIVCVPGSGLLVTVQSLDSAPMEELVFTELIDPYR